MMKHLGNPELYHPHYATIITNSTAELVEGKRSVGEIMDYVQDELLVTLKINFSSDEKRDKQHFTTNAE